MRNVLGLLFVLLLALPVFAGFQGFNGTTDLKVFNKIQCSTGLTCSKVGDKMQVAASGSFSVTNLTGSGTLSGFLQKRVAATATTITAAQCGSTFYNSGAVAINLPEASAVLGCRLTFITMNAANFDVNPDDADQILVLTNAAGDMIRNATLGNMVTLEAVSASQWVPVASGGTWSDAN